jgi:hypothetical protein
MGLWQIPLWNKDVSKLKKTFPSFGGRTTVSVVLRRRFACTTECLKTLPELAYACNSLDGLMFSKAVPTLH